MFTFINKGNYLLVEVSGTYSRNFFIKIIREVAEYGKKENLSKALVDIRNVSGEFSTIERYEIGLEIAKVWAKDVQVASVAKETEVNFLTENVAINRGANFQVFTKMESALEWLNVVNQE